VMAEQTSLAKVETIKIGSVGLSRLWNSDHTVLMLVPDEWAVGRTERFETVYIGPEVAQMQLNLGLAHTTIVRGNRLTIQLLGRQVLEFLKTTYNAFELLDEREVEVADTRPGLLRTFSWTDKATSAQVVQIMLLAADGNTLHDMTGTMAQAAAAQYRPVMEAMLLSVQFGEAQNLPAELAATNNAMVS